MKNKGIKKTFGILMAIILAAGMMTGCGEKKIEKTEQKTSVHEQKKTVKNLKEDDLKNIITGLKDHYILQNAKNIDYLHGLNYDNKIIKKVTSESKNVKLDQVGTYIINYKITVNMTAYEKYQASQKEDKINKIEQDSKELQTINVKKKIDVVDEKKAQELADNGTVVWKDNNDTVAKSDGTEVTEEIKEPDSVEDSKDKKNEGSKSSSDKKQDNRKKDDTQQTKKTDGTTNNTQSTSKPSQSNSGNSGNTSSQPASKPSQSNTGNAGNRPPMGRLGTTLNLQLFLWNNFPILLHLTRELRLQLLYLLRIHTGIHHLPALSFPLYPFYHPSVLSSYRMSYHQPWIHIQQPLFLSLQLPVIMSQFSFSSYFSSFLLF